MANLANALDDLPQDGFVVASVMREPLQATLEFVSWYLGQGADRVVICFDDPDDPAMPVLTMHPKVICIPCHRRFWNSLGIRARSAFPKRQNRAMQFIYDRLQGGWFLNVDGDELVFLEGRTLVQELGQTPDDIRSMTIRPAEAIQAPDGPAHKQFRTPMSKAAAEEVYGPHARLMFRRQGLCGHIVGKSVTRAGLAGVRVRQHFLEIKDGPAVMDRVIGPGEGAYLLHFFDQGYEAWRSKLTWRMSSRGYLPRMRVALERILAGDDPETELRAFYHVLHVFDAQRREMLNKHAALVEIELDLPMLGAQVFPDPLARTDISTSNAA